MPQALSRRRSSASNDEPKEEPRSRRRVRDEDDGGDERTTTRTSRRASRNDDEEDEKPARHSRRSEPEDDADEKPARRGRRTRDDDEDDDSRGSSRRSRRSAPESKATGGFGAYSKKRQANSSFADEFKPEAGKETLFKVLDSEFFDVYQEHWVEELRGSGDPLSYVCLDDEEYFGKVVDCPLCEIGEPSSTKALLNVLDLSNPRKPQVKVWKTTVTVADILERMAGEKRTSPLDRDDLYFVVKVTKKARKTTYEIDPIKARDLEDDFDMVPLEEEEIEEFLKDRFEDRKAITRIDDFDTLDKIADKVAG